MNNTDLVHMIGNLSQSLFSVQYLISGFAYLLGLLFFISALLKLKKMSGRNSHEKIFVPIAYLLGGVAMFFLPSAMGTLANTTFGTGNILEYTSYNPYDIQNSMGLVIRTAGLLWFMRGCVLLVHASEPGIQHGPKGLAFLCAGVLAMNFENTIGFLNFVMGHLEALTLSIKRSQGY